MKLHLRVRRFAGVELRLLTLRPGLRVHLSTNRFHGTWHLLGDGRTARLLGHLMYGLAYQRQPGTAILLHGGHLLPNPFDAARSDPVLLVPDWLTFPTLRSLKALRRSLWDLGRPDTTVRWRTFGLASEASEADERPRWRRERMERIAGLLVYRAPREILRIQGRYVATLFPSRFDNYHYLADHWWNAGFAEGEVQTFRHYRRMVGAAKHARQELLAHGVPVDEAPWKVWEASKRRLSV